MSAFRNILTFFVCLTASWVQANPAANFKLSVKQGCVPLTVNFTDQSTGGTLTYLWEFGNGNQSTLKNPSAIYYQSGKFSVKLTVTDANGNKSVKVFSAIRVFANPVASFSADTVACTGEFLKFKDLSVKADTVINQWTWDFGDGNLDYAQNPKHAYSYSGRFNIGLTVKDAFGCKSLATKVNYIRIKAGPQSSFKLDKTFNCQLPGVFRGTNTSQGGGTYKWEISNGSTATTKDYTTNITAFGIYKIRLIATNNGCIDTSTQTVSIEKLNPKFDLDYGNVCSGSRYLFSNKTTPLPPGTRFEWDFGDGNTDTAKNAKHSYSVSGRYTIKMTVINGTCRSEFSKDIQVYPRPDAEISVLDSTGCKAPFKAQFKITGGEYNISYWTFGDESMPNQFFIKDKPIEHTYTENGNYKVNTRLINAYGCATDYDLPNNISVGTQEIKIDPEEISGCVPLKQLYKANVISTEDIIEYEWVFNDSPSVVYKSKEVLKVFGKDGVYSISVKARTSGGCIITDHAKASIGLHYEPAFRILKDHYCNKDVVKYLNTSHDSVKKVKNIKFYLRFQDSANNGEDSLQPGFTYDSFLNTKRGGLYRLKLVANDRGCETESPMSDSIYVHGPYLKLYIKSLDCKSSKVLLQPRYSWANRAYFYKDTQEIQPIRDTVLSYDGTNMYYLKAYNDTFNCADSVKVPEENIIKYRDPGVTLDVNQTCAPVRAIFNHNKTLKNARWEVISDGDTSRDTRFIKTFRKGGTQKIRLTGHYDSSLCSDTSYLNVVVDEVRTRSNVISSGKCLPVTLSLYDSAVGSDNSLHTWKVNGVEVPASTIKTEYYIESLMSGDSGVKVIHTVQSPQGCISEREFHVPVAGPVLRYTITRFANCDTPVIYFKTFVDSQRCKFPLQYKWESSSGLSSNQPNFNNKFRVMGMEYMTLKVTDAKGCTTIFKDSIEISPNMLQPLFKANPTGRFCPPLTCEFTDMSKTFNSEIISWEWDFGDGSGSNLREPRKLYLIPGKYDIKLTIKSRSGCTATLLKPGYIIVNGPRGSYDFDRGDACLPHTVEFRGKAMDSATMEWDLGDGVVQQGNNFKHIYKRPGRFIPAMILSDTLGCKYTLPPIDTIEVFDYPNAILKAEGLCLKQPIKISQTAVSNHDNKDMKFQWYFNGNARSPGADSIYKPEFRGINKVRLIVENAGTCKDTSDLDIRIFAPVADFEIKDKFICLGMPIRFYNLSKSDSGLAAFEWQMGDGAIKQGAHISHQYSKSGQYDVMLIAEDKLGCRDTLIKPEYAIVGDTIAPENVPIRRVSVLDDHAVELVFSKMNSFDFNSYSIYKESGNSFRKIREITSKNDTVFVDRLCNTLSNSYCFKVRVKNLCLLNSDLNLAREHCTIETRAAGEFEQNNVTWSPYVGFDSISQYQIWRSDVSDPNRYELLSVTDGKTLKYIDSVMSCFTRKNYRITAIQEGGFKEYSNSDTAAAKPYYINNTLPNYVWRTTVENNDYLRLEWLNNAWSRRGIKGYLVNKTFADGRTVFSDRYFDANDTILEDMQTNVQEYSYLYSMRGIDNCLDTTPWSNPAQSILLKGSFDMRSNKPQISWNPYRVWSQGIDHYEVERKLPDGSFVKIGTTGPEQTTFIDMSAEENCSPDYVYRVRAVSKPYPGNSQTAYSLSNETKVLPYSTLFVPSAFSPDANNINEKFGPKGQYISKYSLKIYNRWGELLYSTTDCMQSWDGSFKGEICQQDVYMYIIEAKGADNKVYNLNGTFTLLR